MFLSLLNLLPVSRPMKVTPNWSLCFYSHSQMLPYTLRLALKLTSVMLPIVPFTPRGKSTLWSLIPELEQLALPSIYVMLLAGMNHTEGLCTPHTPNTLSLSHLLLLPTSLVDSTELCLWLFGKPEHTLPSIYISLCISFRCSQLKI